MKKSPLLLGAALGLALLVTGCETNGTSSRIQEKSAVYATLKPWQKKNIDAGVVAMTFTPDMVYMAIGNPSSKTVKTDGSELWTYKNYYPTEGASRAKQTLTTDIGLSDSNSANGIQTESNGAGGRQTMGSGKGGVTQSASTTGGPQGGSMEPPDLQSYTLYVTMTNGAVSHLKLDANP
ncbi:MAG: hypothetical protein ABI222_17760 [Opitutaceae bacterium]